MTQYINKDAVVAEIERRIKAIPKDETDKRLRAVYGNEAFVLVKLISFLDSLEVKELNTCKVEPASEDLEQAFCHYTETIDNYPSNQDEEKYMYNAFQAGAQWQRKQMLKAAVEGTLSSTITGSEQTVWAYAGYGEYGKDGDKVKLLILKDNERKA